MLGVMVLSGWSLSDNALAVMTTVCSTPTVSVVDPDTHELHFSYQDPICTSWDLPDASLPSQSLRLPDQGDAIGFTDSRLSGKIQLQSKDCNDKDEVTSQPVVIATGNKIKPESDFMTSQGNASLGVLRMYDK
jgi:hypothetical protein